MEDHSPYANLLIITLLTFIAVNLFVLDIKVFSPQENFRISDISTQVSPLPTQIIQEDNIACPQTCISVINEATKSSPAIGGPEALPSVSLYQSVLAAPREYYIPLGSGSTSKNSWEDLAGTETTIDPANYGNIKEAYFIASVKNSTQNGQTDLQLFNVTDKHPVWYSQVTMNGPQTQTLTSSKITLDTGNKLYRVQMKNSMSNTVTLESAKIRIIVE